MPHNTLLAALAFGAAAALVGCGKADQPAPPGKSASPKQISEADSPDDAADRSNAYVECRATLTSFTKDHAWFDEGSVGQDDGVAPLASFVLAAPAEHVDRSVNILFKYSADAAAATPPGETEIGRQFAVQLPVDFLKGESKVIDNASVRRLRKLAP